MPSRKHLDLRLRVSLQSMINDSLEVRCLGVTRKVAGTGELKLVNEMDKIGRIAVRLLSAARLFVYPRTFALPTQCMFSRLVLR